jgi:hypothetical protein
MTVKEVIERLGMSRQRFGKSKLAEFLTYYQKLGEHRAYLISDVNDFAYWLMVRKGMIALGHWHKTTSRLLPEGETMEDKRSTFEGWLLDDLYGTECPSCEGPAVQGEMGGDIWCQNCGIV